MRAPHTPPPLPCALRTQAHAGSSYPTSQPTFSFLCPVFHAQAHAVQRAIADGMVFIPPYDDPYTIAGQGTIGDEILRQVSC